MRIYIADLAAYNNGYLVGDWIDLPSSDIWADVQKVLDQGTSIRVFEGVYDGVPSEEWAIHDYEAPFRIGEYDDLDSINKLAEEFDQMDDQDIKKVSYLVNYQGEDMIKAVQHCDDVEVYEDMSYNDLAEHLVDETWNVPEHLENYIDYDKFAGELEMDYAQVGNDLYYSQY